MYTYRRNSDRELRHGVEGRRAAVDEVLNELGEGAASSPVLAEFGDLLLGGDLASNEQPEESFGQRLVTTGRLRKEVAAFGDAVATEADTLLSIEHRAVPEKSGETTHTTVDLVYDDRAKGLLAMLSTNSLDL